MQKIKMRKSSPFVTIVKKWHAFSPIMLVLFLFFSLGFYVFQVNVSTLKSYKLEEQNLIAQKLKETHNDLLLEEAKLKSLQRIDEGLVAMGLVDTDDVVYVNLDTEAFAKK